MPRILRNCAAVERSVTPLARALAGPPSRKPGRSNPRCRGQGTNPPAGDLRRTRAYCAVASEGRNRDDGQAIPATERALGAGL